MANLRAKFTFPPTLIKIPVIWELAHRFSIVTNIRRAEVDEGFGWVILELTGEEDQIQQGLEWVRTTGVRVDPIAGDVIEG